MIELKLEEYVQANADASTKKCHKLLGKLEAPLVSKLKKGYCAKNGGFAEFQRDIRKIQKEYNAGSDLGVHVHC